LVVVSGACAAFGVVLNPNTDCATGCITPLQAASKNSKQQYLLLQVGARGSFQQPQMHGIAAGVSTLPHQRAHVMPATNVTRAYPWQALNEVITTVGIRRAKGSTTTADVFDAGACCVFVAREDLSWCGVHVC
jgi:hypothetical protein